MNFFSMIKEAVTGPTVDFKSLIAEGAVIVDVRSKSEFQSGHAKKSINIPLQSIGNKIASFKGKQVIPVCRSGARSGQAMRMLKDNGIEAYNAGAWQNI